MLRPMVAALFLTLALVASEALAQDLQTKANEIRNAMEARDFDRAEKLTRELRASDPAAFALNNFDYLLARLAERRGLRAEASSLYLGLINRNSNLTQYALWHLSELARAAGDLALERQYLSRLIGTFPSSALIGQARNRMIHSLRESKDYRSTISMLRPLASATGTSGREAMARLGEAYARAGDSKNARLLFGQLVASSRDDHALAAATGLDALDRAERVKPNEFDALRRARIYLFNRHWAEARAHFLYIAEQFPESPNRSEAVYQTGFTYYRDDNQDEAVKWFDRAHSEFPNKKDGEQGYYWVATALQKARRYEEAAKRYIDFIAAYPNSDLKEAAYRNVVDSFRYGGKDAEAISWSRRIQSDFAREPLEVVGLFNEAKIELTRGNFDAALQLFTRLQAMPSYSRLSGAPIVGEVAFLRIYTLEQMGRVAEAARAYMTMPAGRDNYFGNRATLRLQALLETVEGRRAIEPLLKSYRDQAQAALRAARYSEAKDAATQALRLITDERAKREMIEVLRAAYSRLPAYNVTSRYSLVPAARAVIPESQSAAPNTSHASLAAELIFLGLYDEGATELRLGGFGGARSPEANGDTAYSIAVYSNRGDQSHHAMRWAEPASKAVPQDYRLELLPRDFAEMIYPAPYRDALLRYGKKNDIDPRLVLALARQESRFNPSVKSAAAARGLVQFINETALKLAQDESMKNFEIDDVYEPEIAIRLASRNVANLFKQFPDNPYAVAGAYNTYDTNVERWIFRSRSSDVDRFVAEVAIPETKDYIAKVMNNYWAYRQLYTKNLAPQR